MDTISPDSTTRNGLELELIKQRAQLEQQSRDLQELYTQTRALEKVVHKKAFELSLFRELTSVLLSTLDLKQILHRILVGVTANEGLGFNRAFLLLVEPLKGVLEGRMAMGPANLEEALRIWGELSSRQVSFSELWSSLDERWLGQDVFVNRMVRDICIPLESRNHILIRLLNRECTEIIVQESEIILGGNDLLQLFQVDCLAASPLVYRHRPLGLLLADNRITQKRITPEDALNLKVFANYAAAALENSRLYEEVRMRVRQNERHIRELEQMQNRLIRSKKLSELGELASKMAHEIRTPLVSIGGFANLLLKQQGQENASREYLQIIVDEVRRLEQILSNVLSFVSPGIPQLCAFDLHALLSQALFILHPALEEAKIQVETDLTSDPPRVLIDPNQMKQVFLILLQNARDSMPEGGTLILKTIRNEDFLQIQVSDTGVGIARDKLDKVFDAFFTTKSKGSGLGLNIASQIVAHHKGSIYVESELGCGATFFINLPLWLEANPIADLPQYQMGKKT